MLGERIPDGYLFAFYRSYIGEPDSRRDVYVGFGLFLSGIVLAGVALALFLWSSSFERSGDTAYFEWARSAYALGMLSLPAMMLGVVVLLPSERKVLGVSLAGVAVTVAATVGFVLVYPQNWNFMGDVDYTVEVTATYAVGFAGITASTGAALIAHYLDMARTVEALEADDDGEHYSDEEIESDIDAAMEGVELSWGGVERSENKRLSFTDHEFEEVDIDAEAKTTRSTGVDDQVAGLKGLKGGETTTTTSGSTVDDQTRKLKELREQKRSETDDADGGVLAAARRPFARVGGRLRRLVGR